MKRCLHYTWALRTSGSYSSGGKVIRMSWCSICGCLEESIKKKTQTGITFWEGGRWMKPIAKATHRDKPF